MANWLYDKATNTIAKHDNSDELFVWQRMRTSGHTITRINDHLSLADEVCITLWGKGHNISAQELQQNCTRLMLRGNYSSKSVHIVELRIEYNGNYTLGVIDTSIYKGFEMRLVRPTAHLVVMAGEHLSLPTSAALTTHRLATTIAQANNCAIAITTDSRGVVYSVDGAAPIITKGRKIILSPTIKCVESRVLKELLKAKYGDNFSVAPITIDDIRTADELFYADSRGITSVGQLGESYYADSIAYATAKQL